MDTLAKLGIDLLAALSPLILAAAAYGAKKLSDLIRAKIDNEYLEGVLVRLNEATFTVVKEMHQTVVNELKVAASDGKLTPDEKRRIKAKALELLKSYLGVKGLGELQRILGLSEEGLKEFLASKLEAAVHDVKTTSKAAAATANP